MMNYLVFFYPDYEAAGGMHDCIGNANTKEEAQALVLTFLANRYGWEDNWHGYFLHNDAHIYSITDERVVSKIITNPYPNWEWIDI